MLWLVWAALLIKTGTTRALRNTERQLLLHRQSGHNIGFCCVGTAPEDPYNTSHDSGEGKHYKAWGLFFFSFAIIMLNLFYVLIFSPHLAVCTSLVIFLFFWKCVSVHVCVWVVHWHSSLGVCKCVCLGVLCCVCWWEARICALQCYAADLSVLLFCFIIMLKTNRIWYMIKYIYLFISCCWKYTTSHDSVCCRRETWQGLKTCQN